MKSLKLISLLAILMLSSCTGGSKDNFKFEITVGTFRSLTILRDSGAMEITNRDTRTCTNAVITMDDYYSTSLDKTSFSYPTSMSRNKKDIQPQETVKIVDPPSTGYTSEVSPFKDSSGREAGRFTKMRKLKIECAEGTGEYTFK